MLHTNEGRNAFIHAAILPRIKKDKWEKNTFHSNARYSVRAFENSPKILHTHNNRIARTHTTALPYSLLLLSYPMPRIYFVDERLCFVWWQRNEICSACVYSNNNHVFGAFSWIDAIIRCFSSNTQYMSTLRFSFFRLQKFVQSC